jgi:hypothetical protein
VVQAEPEAADDGEQTRKYQKPDEMRHEG